MSNVLPPVEVAFAVKGAKPLAAALGSIAASLAQIQSVAGASGVAQAVAFQNATAAAQKHAQTVGKSTKESAGVFQAVHNERLRAENQFVDDAIKQDRKIRAIRVSAHEREVRQRDRNEDWIANRDARRAESDWRIKERGRANAERMLRSDSKNFDKIAAREGWSGFSTGATHAAGLGKYASATGAEMAGMGAVGLALGAIDLFGSALSMATNALSQFGGFLVADVIQPQMHLLTTMQQFANRMGGGAGLASNMRGQVNAWEMQHLGLSREQIVDTYGEAIAFTHDPRAARMTTDIALTAGQAKGFEPAHIAKMIGYGQADMRGLSPEMLEAYATESIRKLLAVGSGMNVEEFSSIRDRLGTWTSLSRPKSEAEEAALRIGWTALVAQGSKGAHRVQGGVAGIDSFVNDVMKNDIEHPGHRVATDASGALLPIAGVIARYIDRVGGNVTMMGPLGKAGKQLAGYGFGGGLTQRSLDFMRQISVDEVWRAAEAAKKGSGREAVESHVSTMMAISGKSSSFKEENDAINKLPEQQINGAMLAIRQAFYGLLPVVETQLVPQLKAFADWLAKAIADDGVAKIADALKMLGQAIAGFAYFLLSMPGVQSVTGLSDEQMDKFGSIAGNREALIRQQGRVGTAEYNAWHSDASGGPALPTSGHGRDAAIESARQRDEAEGVAPGTYGASGASHLGAAHAGAWGKMAAESFKHSLAPGGWLHAPKTPLSDPARIP